MIAEPVPIRGRWTPTDMADVDAEPSVADPIGPEPITWRTLADVSDDPPGPLLFGMLEDGPTLALGVADLADDMLAETENAPAGEIDRIRERLGRALQRMRHEGWVERLGKGGRGTTWQLRDRP